MLLLMSRWDGLSRGTSVHERLSGGRASFATELIKSQNYTFQMRVWGTSVRERGGGPWALYWRQWGPKNPGEWPQGPKSFHEWGAIWAFVGSGIAAEGGLHLCSRCNGDARRKKGFSREQLRLLLAETRSKLITL